GSHGEAIRYFQAVLALRPSSASGYIALGQSLQELGRNKEAAEQFERALKLAPTSTVARATLVVVLLQLGRDGEADVHLRQLLAVDAKSVGIHYRLRTTLIQRGRVDEALSAWKAAIDAYPAHDIHYGYAEYCLFVGRGEEYRRERRDLLAGFGTIPDLNPFVAERPARACLLLPAPGDELRQAVSLADRAVAVDRTKYTGAYPYFRFVQGLADYRQGRLDLAISTMRGD